MRGSRHVAAPARGRGWGRAPRWRRERAWLGAGPEIVGAKPSTPKPPPAKPRRPQSPQEMPKAPPPGSWGLPAQAPKGAGKRRDEPKAQKLPQKLRGFTPGLAKMWGPTLKTPGIYPRVGQKVGTDPNGGSQNRGTDPKNSRGLRPGLAEIGGRRGARRRQRASQTAGGDDNVY